MEHDWDLVSALKPKYNTERVVEPSVLTEWGSMSVNIAASSVLRHDIRGGLRVSEDGFGIINKEFSKNVGSSPVR